MNHLFPSVATPLSYYVGGNLVRVDNSVSTELQVASVEQPVVAQAIDIQQEWQVRNKQVEVLLEEAKSYLNRDCPQEALKIYDQALELIPKHIPSLIGQVKCLLETRMRINEIEAKIDFLVSQTPTVFEIMPLKAHWLVIQGRKEEALAIIEDYLEKNPTDVDAWVIKSWALETSTCYILPTFDYSIEYLLEPCQKALTIDENHTQALFTLGEYYLKLPDVRKALESFEKIGKKHSNNYIYFNGMGDYLLELKKYQEAENFYNQSLFVQQNNLVALIGLLKVYFTEERWILFDEVHNKFRQFHPSYARGWQLLAEASIIRCSQTTDLAAQNRFKQMFQVAHQKFLQTTCYPLESIDYLISFITQYDQQNDLNNPSTKSLISSFAKQIYQNIRSNSPHDYSTDIALALKQMAESSSAQHSNLSIAKSEGKMIIETLYSSCLQQIEKSLPSEKAAHYFRLANSFSNDKDTSNNGFFNRDAQKVYDCLTEVINRPDTIIKEVVAASYFFRIKLGDKLFKFDNIKLDFQSLWQTQLYLFLRENNRFLFLKSYIGFLDRDNSIPLQEKLKIGLAILEKNNHPDIRLAVQKWKKQAKRTPKQPQTEPPKSPPTNESKQPLKVEKQQKKPIKPRNALQPQKKSPPLPIVPIESPPPLPLSLQPYVAVPSDEWKMEQERKQVRAAIAAQKAKEASKIDAKAEEIRKKLAERKEKKQKKSQQTFQPPKMTQPSTSSSGPAISNSDAILHTNSNGGAKTIESKLKASAASWYPPSMTVVKPPTQAAVDSSFPSWMLSLSIADTSPMNPFAGMQRTVCPAKESKKEIEIVLPKIHFPPLSVDHQQRLETAIDALEQMDKLLHQWQQNWIIQDETALERRVLFPSALKYCLFRLCESLINTSYTRTYDFADFQRHLSSIVSLRDLKEMRHDLRSYFTHISTHHLIQMTKQIQTSHLKTNLEVWLKKKEIHDYRPSKLNFFTSFCNQTQKKEWNEIVQNPNELATLLNLLKDKLQQLDQLKPISPTTEEDFAILLSDRHRQQAAKMLLSDIRKCLIWIKQLKPTIWKILNQYPNEKKLFKELIRLGNHVGHTITETELVIEDEVPLSTIYDYMQSSQQLINIIEYLKLYF